MVTKEESVRNLLKSLESMKFFSTLYELERESGIKLRSYGKEIDFFYEITMEGRYEDIKSFIIPLSNRNQVSYNKVAYIVGKQEFLEKLEKSMDPKLDDLITLLKEIEKTCPSDDFSKFCSVLSLNKVTDHEDYTD